MTERNGGPVTKKSTIDNIIGKRNVEAFEAVHGGTAMPKNEVFAKLLEDERMQLGLPVSLPTRRVPPTPRKFKSNRLYKPDDRMHEREVEDGRTLEWLAVASQAHKPGIDRETHLLRTAFLMTVRYQTPQTPERFASDVVSAAAVTCGVTRNDAFHDVELAFAALYEKIYAVREERWARRDFDDEIVTMQKRLRVWLKSLKKLGKTRPRYTQR